MAPFAREVLKNLRGSLVLLVLMLALGAICVVVSTRLLNAERKAFSATQAKVNDIRSRLGKAREEEQDIKARLVRYEELLARGIIGEEERLDWVEQIRRIKSERRLLELEYEISPQKAVSQSLLPGTGGSFEFYASPMMLRMSLLHELDLLRFLADLRASIHAHVRVRECTMSRAAPAASSNGPLRADCRLDLITTRERKST